MHQGVCGVNDGFGIAVLPVIKGCTQQEAFDDADDATMACGFHG